MLALWNFAAGHAAQLLVPPAIQGSHDPAEPRQPAWIGPAQAPNGALSSAANDAHTGRSRPRSQGGSQPPRSNGQAFDEARNPLTVAGRRRYKAFVFEGASVDPQSVFFVPVLDRQFGIAVEAVVIKADLRFNPARFVAQQQMHARRRLG
jgi:hypothetical protein